MGVAGQDDEIELQQQDSTTDDPPADDPATDPPNGDDPPQDPPADGEVVEEDEDVVQIGEEEPPASEEVKAAPQWVKDLRQEQKRLRRENAELKARIGTPSVQQAPQLPEKPKLADYDFDEEKFQAAVDGWYAKKREVEAFEASQKAAVEAHQKAEQVVRENYAKSKAVLKVKNFQEAEEEVAAQLPAVLQTALMKYPANPAAMVYALGTNPKELQRLSSIKDPAEFLWQASKLEEKVKVTTRAKGTQKPAPETTLRGNSNASSSKATLERLQAEADRTGDRTKVAAYLRQQKQAGK